MKNESREHPNVMRKVFLAVALITVFSLSGFALQLIYSNNVNVDMEARYGLYQNGVYKDTDGVLVPSPFAVRRITLTIVNAENSTRDITATLNFQGNASLLEPAPISRNEGAATWSVRLGPFEEAQINVTGTQDLEAGAPYVLANGATVTPKSTNKTLAVNNLSNRTSSGIPTTFGYVREQGVSDLLTPVFAEQRRLDIVAKSVIVIFAGLVVLTMASGFAFVFGKEERPPSGRKGARIHIGDIYHNGESQEEFSKYKYEESEYWKR